MTARPGCNLPLEYKCPQSDKPVLVVELGFDDAYVTLPPEYAVVVDIVLKPEEAAEAKQKLEQQPNGIDGMTHGVIGLGPYKQKIVLDCIQQFSGGPNGFAALWNLVYGYNSLLGSMVDRAAQKKLPTILAEDEQPQLSTAAVKEGVGASTEQNQGAEADSTC
eukprot:g8200.t1